MAQLRRKLSPLWGGSFCQVVVARISESVDFSCQFFVLASTLHGMPFGIAETIALISASMQAIELYAKYGGTRGQVIQTLNLQYQPQNYRKIEQQVLSLGSGYDRLFEKAGEYVQRCIDKFTEAMDDDLLPQDREALGDAATACLCKQIKLLKDFMGMNIPKDLQEKWRTHNCDDYFKNRKAKTLGMLGGAANQRELA